MALHDKLVPIYLQFMRFGICQSHFCLKRLIAIIGNEGSFIGRRSKYSNIDCGSRRQAHGPIEPHPSPLPSYDRKTNLLTTGVPLAVGSNPATEINEEERQQRQVIRVTFCGQSYKHFTLINYASRVVIWGIFQSGMTPES